MQNNIRVDAGGRIAFETGNALAGLGRFEEAEASYRRAIALNPRYPEAFNNLGNILHDMGRFEEAEASYRRAVSINPFIPDVFNNLGVVLRDMGRFEEAEASYRRAIALNPRYPEAFNNLGTVLQGLGRLEEAEASYRRAMELNPLSGEAAANLANTLKDAGKIEDAVILYEKALSLNPRLAECYLNLGAVKKYTPGDQRIPALRKLYASAKIAAEKSSACFALAKACEDTENFDEAFSLYSEGNSLRKMELGYKIEKDAKVFSAVKSAFGGLDSESLKAEAGAGAECKTPILIVGMPRSGTSLVEQILASHPMVFGAGELENLNGLARKHFLGGGADGVLPAIKNISADYLGQISGMGINAPFVTDKMPINFRWLGFLMSRKNVKIVNVSRTPEAVCWSNFKTYFTSRRLGFACDLEDIAEYYIMYEDIMSFWRERFSGRIYDLSYEALTENQEEETRKLLDYCGLPWDAACLEFEKNGRAVRTASAAQVRRKIYRGSSEAWKRFEKHLGPLLERLERLGKKLGERGAT